MGVSIVFRLIHNGEVAFELSVASPALKEQTEQEASPEPHIEGEVLPLETSVLSPGLALPLPG